MTDIKSIFALAQTYSQDLPAAPLLPPPPQGAALAGWIDHTLLKPDATPAQVQRLCQEAHQFGFKAVCVNSLFLPLCQRELEGSPVLLCTVVGFPLGASLTSVKVHETQAALDFGALEIDMVLAVGLLKAAEYAQVLADIQATAEAAHAGGARLKVILETALLNREEKIMACLLSKQAGADFVKTSTGFGGGGATVADIDLMRRVVGPDLGVKASGGVRTLADAQALIAAGASRIGASSGVQIVQQAQGVSVAPAAGGY